MSKPSEHVVILHGLFMNKVVMKPLRNRFRKAGYEASCFGYNTVGEILEVNVDALHGYLKTLDAPVIHLVGHSMGGLIIRFLFERYPDQKPGRVVSLGTPHQGAQIALWLNDTFLSPLLGKSREMGLITPPGAWSHENPFGSLAGLAPIGPLPILTGNWTDSDGTVLVSETHLEGQTDHIVVSGMHTQLIYTESVFEQTRHFIENNRFNHEQQQEAV